MRHFELCDLGFVEQGERDVMTPVEQALATKRIDLERQLESLRVANLIGLEVDGKSRSGVPRGAGEQQLDVGLVEANGQQAVREAGVE